MPDKFNDVQPFAALKRPAVEALARLLYMKSSTTTFKTNSSCDQWLSSQRRQIHQLQDASIRRQGKLSLMADVFRGDLTRPHETIQAMDTASLCEVHEQLNPLVLSGLMKLVTEETTLCTDRFRKYRDKATIQRQKSAAVVEVEMNPAIKSWLDSISQIPALWMGKTRWEDEMKRRLEISLPVCARYQGCVACKLSVVGGSVQFLMDLRTSLLVRKEYEADMQGVEDEENVQSPLLLRMVEAWIDMCYAMKKRHFIRQESEMLAPMVVALWGEMSAKKQTKRKGLKRGGDSRKYTNSGWPMPLAPLMEVDVQAFEGRYGGGVEELEDDGLEDGVVAGRRRKSQTGQPQEGYSHHFPAGLFFADIPVEDESPLDRLQGDLQNRRPNDGRGVVGATPSKRRINTRLPRTNTSRLPSKVVGSSASSSNSRDTWNTDYKKHIIASSSVPATEAGLSTIYGLYGRSTDGKSTTAGAGAGARSATSTSVARPAPLNVRRTGQPPARRIVPPAMQVSDSIGRSLAGSLFSGGSSRSHGRNSGVPAPPASVSSGSSRDRRSGAPSPPSGRSSVDGSSRGRRSGAPSPADSRESSNRQRPLQSSVATPATSFSERSPTTWSELDESYTYASFATTRAAPTREEKGKGREVDARPPSRLQRPRSSASLLQVPPQRLQDRMAKSVLPRPLQLNSGGAAGESRLPKPPPAPASSVYSVSTTALMGGGARKNKTAAQLEEEEKKRRENLI